MGADVQVQLILLLPLAGALFNGLGGLFLPGLRERETLFGIVGTLVVAIPFVLILLLFLSFAGEPLVLDYYTWMAAGDFQVSFAYRVDELSLLMGLVVSGVGALIHLYSVGYMHGDPGYWRFFAYMNLFIFMMLNLVFGDNLLVLFLGWEGVGLCSYLLIGFWYTDLKNSAAANKAFIVNRIGDFAFLMAMFILFRELGSARFRDCFSPIRRRMIAVDASTGWCCCSLSARPGRARRFLCSSGCRMPWRARRPSRR